MNKGKRKKVLHLSLLTFAYLTFTSIKYKHVDTKCCPHVQSDVSHSEGDCSRSPSGEIRKATLFPGPKITDHLTNVPSRCAHLQLTDGACGSSQTASAITVSIKTISVPLIRAKMWNRRDNYPCKKTRRCVIWSHVLRSRNSAPVMLGTFWTPALKREVQVEQR